MRNRVPGTPALARLAICCAAFCCLAFIPAPANAQGVVGDWEGTITFRGDAMPIRLHIQDDGSPQAELDIPSMLMAWEPIPMEATEQGSLITFPFGIGELLVSFQGETASATSQLANEELKLKLARADNRPFERDDFTFASGETKLAGAIVLPEGDGPFPAVVLIHGSGNQGKGMYEYRSWADVLVRLGYAVMFYDKRGVGDSEGESPADLVELIEDASAAVEYLRGRPEVAEDRIGLLGSSQGAWVAEQVAAEDDKLAFMILICAAAGTPRNQDMQQLEYGMRADGRSEQDIESALAYAGLYFYVARTGHGWSLLQEAIAKAQQAEWGQYVDQPETLEQLAWWRANHDFQPIPAVRQIEIPVLLLYGGADWITPPIENAEKLKSLFPDPALVQVHVFPGADHRLELPMGTDAAGQWRWPKVAAANWPELQQWLDDNAGR